MNAWVGNKLERNMRKESMWETEKATVAVGLRTSVYYVFSVLQDYCRDSRRGGEEGEERQQGKCKVNTYNKRGYSTEEGTVW